MRHDTSHTQQRTVTHQTGDAAYQTETVTPDRRCHKSDRNLLHTRQETSHRQQGTVTHQAGDIAYQKDTVKHLTVDVKHQT